ncbi:MAG: formylglycine-generating enzyme family protein [Puniceicoccales bacterium]|jgi:hypothetical protein|nr:formylglycine-generating enzyme family protein [Puniceicoccales bacterium]
MRLAFRRGDIRQTLLQILLILAIAIAALGSALFFANLGPKTASRPKDYQQERREAEDLRVKSEDLWERFKAIKEARPNLIPTPEDEKLLEEALFLREKYISLNHNQSDPKGLIEDIRGEWHTVKARECRTLGKVAEMKGLTAMQKEDFRAAAEAYGEADRMETLIGDNYQLSKMRDVSRAHELQHQQKLALGTPILRSLKKSEKEADAIVAKLAPKTTHGMRVALEVPAIGEPTETANTQWTKAAELYRDAWQKAILLRDNYDGLFNIEYNYPDQLESKYETALSSPENIKLLRLLAEVRAKAATENFVNSDAAATEVLKLWNTIFERYSDMSKIHPKSDYVRVGRTNPLAKLSEIDPIEPLREERDHAIMRHLRNTLEKRIAALDAALRSGNHETAGIEAVRILQAADEAQKKYRRSTAISGQAHSRLKYLSARDKVIPNVRNILNGTLLPIPGKPDLLLGRAEVSQILYTLVMDTNPSAVRGDLLPVDSVTYADAALFCERAGWLAGLSARLPSAAEFQAAVGDPAGRAIQVAAANAAETSNGAPRQVDIGQPNAAGFVDLFGNLAEWTLPQDPASADTLEIGGNYKDSRETLATLPQRTASRRDANRLRGFRILVEKNPAPAPAPR